MDRRLWREINDLGMEGLGMRAIAKRLGVHRRTVREALEASRPPVDSRATRGSIIDPHCGWLLAQIEQHPELSAAALHRQLAERGFEGGYSLVKQTVAELRPRAKKAYPTLSFEPGECAQVDWGVWKGVDVPGGRRRLSFFVMVLCHSRMMHVEFFPGESMEYWLRAHRNAFEAFGGFAQGSGLAPCGAHRPAQPRGGAACRPPPQLWKEAESRRPRTRAAARHPARRPSRTGPARTQPRHLLKGETMNKAYDTKLKQALAELQLAWMLDNHEHELAEAARKNRTAHELLQRLLDGELDVRHERAISRRIKEAKLKDVRALQGFDFSWPTKINCDQVRHLAKPSSSKAKATA